MNFALIAVLIVVSVMASLLIVWSSIRAFNGIMEELDVFYRRYPRRAPHED